MRSKPKFTNTPWGKAELVMTSNKKGTKIHMSKKRYMELMSKGDNRKYAGESGEIYKIAYIPRYMENWPSWLITISCWIIERLPLKIQKKIKKS